LGAGGWANAAHAHTETKNAILSKWELLVRFYDFYVQDEAYANPFQGK
jgi:hypothetical protein